VKKCALLLLVLALGCATTPTASPPPALGVSVSGGTQLDLLGRAAPAEVDAFATRFDELRAAGRDRCCVALVQDAPDLGFEVLERTLRSRDAALAESVARSLGGARLLDATALLAARAKAPERHRAAWDGLASARSAICGGTTGLASQAAKAARDEAARDRTTLADLGDTLGVARADLLVLLAGGDGDSIRPALVRGADDARVLLELAARAHRRADGATATEELGAALRFASDSRDLTLATEVEAARSALALALPPEPLAAWLRHVAGLALDRKRPLVALRSALDAERIAEPGNALSRALVARAQLAGGEATVALEAALALAKEAHERGDLASEATAVGIAGEALLALERPGDAAGSFERAATLSRQAGDSDAWARRTLNLARTQLRRGEIEDARALLDTLERAAPGSGRLFARIALVRACELCGRDEFAASRAAIDRALAAATAAGDYETAEQALTLRHRLGSLGS
jgi:hypothetical protein